MTDKIIPVPKTIKHDLTGKRFGQWYVLGYSSQKDDRHRKWLCRCDCGTVRSVRHENLLDGRSTSCGCLMKGSKLVPRHGMHKTPEYKAWMAMNERCANPKHKYYEYYGGRGIVVCELWRDSFQVFYDDMGPRPSTKHSLDRIDNAAGYSPNNCRWATKSEQQNNMRSNRAITYEGITLNLSQWARRMGISNDCLCRRLNSGWAIEDALTRPVRENRRRG